MKNYSYINSKTKTLSIYDRSKFENHNSIFTKDLILSKDRTDKIINMKSGTIFHYLPHIFNPTYSVEEINNQEKNRVIELLNSDSIENRDALQFLALYNTY